MRFVRYVALLGILLLPAAYSRAQVSFGFNYGGPGLRLRLRRLRSSGLRLRLLQLLPVCLRAVRILRFGLVL